MMRRFVAMLERCGGKNFLYIVNRITELDGFCASSRIWNRLSVSERAALEHFQQGEDC